MTSANHFDAYALVYYYFSFYRSFLLSFSLSFFFFALRKWGGKGGGQSLGPRVEKRAGGVREAGTRAGSVVFSERKAREIVKKSGGNQD